MSEPTSRDRLIVALDVPTPAEALALVDTLGDTVTFYKIGLELLFTGGLDIATELKRRGKRVFLDMKLLDIANTVERAAAQVAALNLDFLTIHGTDTKTMTAAAKGRGAANLQILAVTVLTNLDSGDLAEQHIATSPADLVLHRARLAKAAGCSGVIASGQEAGRLRAALGHGFLIVTPGIRLPSDGTDDQARITTPDAAIAAGADHIVVGRPVTRAADPRRAAAQFVALIQDAERQRADR
jgi:orotidine-5'-phosphate decarboxylase